MFSFPHEAAHSAGAEKSSHSSDALNKSVLSFYGPRVPGVGKRGKGKSRNGKVIVA